MKKRYLIFLFAALLLLLCGCESKKEVKTGYQIYYLNSEQTKLNPREYHPKSKDAEGMVRSYFPSSRGFKSARYTLALYIDRENHKLVKSLLFDDEKDPYQMNNLSLEENQEVVKDLCAEMGKVLKEIDDPWYKEGILKDMIPY